MADHECPATACTRDVPARMLMCPPHLSRNDPRIEPMFDLRDVAKADADLRDVR